jgi:preprotein translocase subunit YajC
MFQIIALQSGGIGNFVIIPLMFLVIYLFMIRPQIRRQKQEKKFQASISRGARIITTSGIHGKIVDINDKDATVTIETGAGKMKFERSAISMELSKKYAVAPKK